MNRRVLLRVVASAGAVSLAGCTGASDPSATASPSDTTDDDTRPDCPGDTPTPEGPQGPYDSLLLYEVPGYVTEYDETVVVEYRRVGTAGRRAVDRALGTDGPYYECAGGSEPSDVMAFFAAVDARWAETGESHAHTYLHHDGAYYGITLVQEGDFVRVQSVPCTAEACPTTPTPPPG